MASVQEPQLDELRRRARRRLIGAIVLALAAAVLVPMLLESDPKPLGEDVSVRIPPVDDGRFVNQLGDKRGDAPTSSPPLSPPVAPKESIGPREAPAPAKDPVAAESAAKAPPPAKDASQSGVAKTLTDAERKVIAPPTSAARSPESAPRVADKGATEVTKSASKVEPPKAEPPRTDAAKVDAAKAAPKSDAQPAATRPEGTWSVQLAAFADDKGANALAGKLKKAGHPAYTEPYATSRGTLWRVRVGPYPSREAAETARDRLKADGQSGIITAAK